MTRRGREKVEIRIGHGPVVKVVMRKLCVTLGMQDQTSGNLHRYFEFWL